jgi:hypothetical protein
MPFSHRVFCGDTALPSLSEVLVWLRQHEYPVKVAGGRSSGDMLSSFWEELALSVDDAEPPLTLTCVRADRAGMTRLAEEVADFVADIGELPDSPARTRVLEHLRAARALVIIEFGAGGGSTLAHDTAESIATLLVERTQGLAQRDGQGFFDEDDDLVLALG